MYRGSWRGEISGCFWDPKELPKHLQGVSWEPLRGLLGIPGGFLLRWARNVLSCSPPGAPLGAFLGPSWAVLEASWGLLAAKTHQKRGATVFWRPLGTVLASFLKGFWITFLMNFLYFSYLTRRQHVVKPQNYFICSTGEPSEALRGQYFWMTFLYFRGL